MIGTIRRECLDDMIVFNERCFCQHLKMFLDYYHRSRTHLALEKDSPEPRRVQPHLLAGSSRSRKSVDCIIGMSVVAPELRISDASFPCFRA